MADLQRVDLQLESGAERTSVWETDHIQIMRARLAPGGALPHHRSNANVVLVPMSGTLQLTLDGHTEVFGVGEALSVPYDTPMDVSNAGDDEAVFIILKTPHPKAFSPG